MSFGIWRRSIVSPILLLLARILWMRRSGARDRVMLRKAVCVALFVAVPGFLGYPAALNVDPSEKKPPIAGKARTRKRAPPSNSRDFTAAAVARLSRPADP